MTPKAFRDGGAMFMPLSRHMGAAMSDFTPEELQSRQPIHELDDRGHRRGPGGKRPTAFPPPLNAPVGIVVGLNGGIFASSPLFSTAEG